MKPIFFFFFNSKTHSTCYANMRFKTTLIPFVGKTHGKYSFVSHTKTHSRIWTNLLHSCEIACNIWVWIRRMRKHTLTQWNSKQTKIDLEMPFNLHSNSTVCPRYVVSQSVLYVIFQENNQVSPLRRTLILSSF